MKDLRGFMEFLTSVGVWGVFIYGGIGVIMISNIIAFMKAKDDPRVSKTEMACKTYIFRYPILVIASVVGLILHGIGWYCFAVNYNG